MNREQRLCEWIEDSRKPDQTFIVGISGAPGSGKTTLCTRLEAKLAASGTSCVTLSLDDLYLTRAQRQVLAAAVHPLCLYRGPPGTHDIALGCQVLDALVTADPEQRTLIPRFDKAQDDRHPPGSTVLGRPDVILFEGWCVLARPGPAWRAPINAREAHDDPHGEWVRWSEDRLASSYLTLWDCVHGSVYLMSTYEQAVEGRWRQEQALRAARPEGTATMTRGDVERFMALFERKMRHMAAQLPEVVDWPLPAWNQP